MELQTYTVEEIKAWLRFNSESGMGVTAYDLLEQVEREGKLDMEETAVFSLSPA